MTSPIYSDLLQAKMLRGVRKSLADDGNLTAFFGTGGIRLVSYEELEHTIRPPLLCVVTGQAANVGRVISGQANVTYRVPIVMFIPRQTPVNPAVPRPAPPIIYAQADGPFTGVFSYRSTFWNDDGESWASEPVDATFSADAGLVSFGTVPPGVKGARLWRTAKGMSAYRYVETIQTDVLAAEEPYLDELDDSLLGDELAPVQLFVENLKDYLRGVLYAHETLYDEDEGKDLCDAALILSDRIDVIDRTRNLRVVGMVGGFELIYSVETGVSTVDAAP